MNIGLITARGGSKGVPRKNIRLLCGKPLIVWTIEAALNSKWIDFIYVSTDDSEIATISLEHGAKVINRPRELATDHAGSEPVIKHAIDFFKSNGIEADSICLLQPTSPLRNHSHIDAAFELLSKSNGNCVVSVYESKGSEVKAYKLDFDGTISGILSSDSPYMRRQDLPKTFQPNGAIYLFPVKQFTKEEKIPRTKVYPYLMGLIDSADIDTEEDFNAVEKFLIERS